MKDVAFGQYYPADSFVHRLDPRLKLLFLIAFITAIFLADNFYGLAACALVLFAVILASRVPFGKVLRAVRGILFLVIFTAVIQVLFNHGDEVYWGGPAVYWEWKIFAVTQEGIVLAIFLVLRLALLVMCSSMLTYTTTPVALTDGIESLLTPLKWLHIPVHVLALVMNMALSLIPVLTGETERIMNAQKARGADFETGSIFHRIKAIVPILIPLLVSSIDRAEELGNAMDSRCYRGDIKRTKYKKLRFGWRDLIGFLLGAALVTGVVLLRVYPVGFLGSFL